MNAPKKPGTDLAALKARLAKKSQAAEEPAAPQAAPVPMEHVPPPGEVAPPQHHDDHPHYHEPAAPFAPADVPPPGQVSQPAVPGYSAPSAAHSDDPFGGPAMYEPTPAYDSGGDVPSKSSLGVVLFASAIFLAVGLGVGWIGHKIVSGREKLDAAKTKGQEMLGEVQKVADVRKGVSVKLETEVGEVVMTDPKKGSEAILALLQESFDKFPRIENLYGWQLGGIHPTGIKKTFELYEASTRVRTDLAALAGFLAENAASLQAAAGKPVSFGVKFTEGGAVVMVEITGAMCSETPDKPETLAACNDLGKAAAFKVREQIGGQEKTLAKGTAVDQVVFLVPDGQVFQSAIGLEPGKNAERVRDFMMKKVREGLEEMNQSEKSALQAMKNYSDNPDVDGSNPQSEP